MLLWCATPDAVVRSPEKKWSKVYHEEQQHDHLQQYLKQRLADLSSQGVMLMSQVICTVLDVLKKQQPTVPMKLQCGGLHLFTYFMCVCVYM